MRYAVLASASTTEVCVARKRARGPESHRSRRHACRALCHAFVGVSAACRGRFCCLLAPRGFCLYLRVTALVLLLASRDVAVGCLVWVFASFGCESRLLPRGARVKSGNSRIKSRKTGFQIERFRNPKFGRFSPPRAGRHRSPLKKHLWPHALTRVPLVV